MKYENSKCQSIYWSSEYLNFPAQHPLFPQLNSTTDFTKPKVIRSFRYAAPRTWNSTLSLLL